MRSGGQRYFTGFIRDLTERRQTETRLQELQSELVHMSRFTALGEMASTLAHEINQPLTAIASYLKGCRRILSRMEGAEVPMLSDAVNQAAEQALRAGQVIRHLREFVTRGEGERHIEGLPKLIEEASALALVGAKEKGVRVTFALDPTHLSSSPTASRCSRCCSTSSATPSRRCRRTNDASWSSRREPCRRRVWSRCRCRTPAPASRPRSRRNSSTLRDDEGKRMGVGLSICRTIVESHGGKILAETGAAGGTTFRFTLRTIDGRKLAHAQ